MAQHPSYKSIFNNARDTQQLLGDHQLWFSVGAPVGNGNTRTNGLVYNGRPNDVREAAFEAYIKNQAMHTFHFHIITLRNDPFRPVSEYMLRATSGYDVWSQIADLATPSIVTNDSGDPAYTGQLRRLEEDTPCGHRRRLFFTNNKKARQLHARHIIQAQGEAEQRDIAWVPDERFPSEQRAVPVVAARRVRPVVVKNLEFRTTVHSAMTPTWVQAFLQMTPTSVDYSKVAPQYWSATLLPAHAFAFAKGSAAPSMGSFLGLNGTACFKHSMRMEKRDCLVAAAMNSGYTAMARQDIHDFQSEVPSRMEDTYMVLNVKYEHQIQLKNYWKDLSKSLIINVKGLDNVGKG